MSSLKPLEVKEVMPDQQAGAAKPERRLTIGEALREAIAEEMRRDESVFLIGEDIGVPGGFGGAFGVYLGLPEEFGHTRIIDTPISEKAVLGAAIGAAMMGMRPIADLQYGDFIYCCMDEFANEAPKIRYMSGGKLKIPLVFRAPVGATRRGAQHGQSPETLAMHIPGWKVVCVSDAYDAKGLLKTAVRDDNPVVIFEHKLLYGSKGREQAGGFDLTCPVPQEEYTIPFGQAKIRRAGSHVTVVATHMMLYRALVAAETLAQEGIEVEVIDPRTLVPLDKETILNSVVKTGRLVTAHEDNLTAGWGAEVAALAASECFYNLEAPIQRVASYDVPIPFAPVMEDYVVPSVERIIKAIRATLQ
jgi:pyruvate/2-oxoglutarate/acetoin dehydrogenase E1 component